MVIHGLKILDKAPDIIIIVLIVIIIELFYY